MIITSRPTFWMAVYRLLPFLLSIAIVFTGLFFWFIYRMIRLYFKVRWVVRQRADNICWLDVYRELSILVGLEFQPELIQDPAKMLDNCKQFCQSIYGASYKPVWVEKPGNKIYRANGVERWYAVRDGLFVERMYSGDARIVQSLSNKHPDDGETVQFIWSFPAKDWAEFMESK